MTASKATFAFFVLTFAFSQNRSAAQIHALDYDTPAYVHFELSEVTVHEDQDAVVVNLYRTGDFRQYTRVHFSTEELTATEGQDYKGTGGTITFQPGEGIKQIAVPLVKDDRPETNETFRINLSEPGPNTILTGETTVITIRDRPGPTSLPRLEITAMAGGKISLSWEGPASYSIEKTADTATWEKLSCSPVTQGTRTEVVEPAGSRGNLYRLRVQ